MNEKQILEIKTNLASKTIEELSAIWKANNKREYSEEGLEAVRRILVERKVSLPPQDAPVLPPQEHPKSPVKCPSCGSERFKKRFFGGSKGCAIACFVLGGFIAVEELSRPGGDPTVLLLTLVFVLAGITALTSKRYKCLDCKKSFNNAKK